ncbi:casparian strip membrane protein 1 [Prunus yedoensis var. nudiflora]|uniref:CASP-like protein n=1 Tax=Prunus yedoensis var. nudiflora TaxID=2094558 RepID=A0A314ZD62_PRUYE|nr:casparian strip membrane protein 1 [Prunus yedoensis var. nudiflora]
MKAGGAVDATDKEASKPIPIPKVRVSRVLSVLDFILRVVAALGTLASAIAMGASQETLPFAAQFVRFRARYKDLPTLMFFVIANSIVCVYLVLSLPLSFVHIIWTAAKTSRIVLIISDTVMMGLLTAGASAATAIVYLAYYGNSSTNWFAFCRQFNSFCGRISGSLIGSFVAITVLVLLIIMQSVAISRR